MVPSISCQILSQDAHHLHLPEVEDTIEEEEEAPAEEEDGTTDGVEANIPHQHLHQPHHSINHKVETTVKHKQTQQPRATIPQPNPKGTRKLNQ